MSFETKPNPSSFTTTTTIRPNAELSPKRRKKERKKRKTLNPKTKSFFFKGRGNKISQREKEELKNGTKRTLSLSLERARDICTTSSTLEFTRGRRRERVFRARARAVVVVVVARRIRFKSPLCIRAICLFPRVSWDLCKSERGIPRKKGERERN